MPVLPGRRPVSVATRDALQTGAAQWALANRMHVLPNDQCWESSHPDVHPGSRPIIHVVDDDHQGHSAVRQPLHLPDSSTPSITRVVATKRLREHWLFIEQILPGTSTCASCQRTSFSRSELPLSACGASLGQAADHWFRDATDRVVPASPQVPSRDRGLRQDCGTL